MSLTMESSPIPGSSSSYENRDGSSLVEDVSEDRDRKRDILELKVELPMAPAIDSKYTRATLLGLSGGSEEDDGFLLDVGSSGMDNTRSRGFSVTGRGEETFKRLSSSSSISSYGQDERNMESFSEPGDHSPLPYPALNSTDECTDNPIVRTIGHCGSVTNHIEVQTSIKSLKQKDLQIFKPVPSPLSAVLLSAGATSSTSFALTSRILPPSMSASPADSPPSPFHYTTFPLKQLEISCLRTSLENDFEADWKGIDEGEDTHHFLSG